MPSMYQRLDRLEAQRITALLEALDTECARFAACYTRETFNEPLAEVLAPFSDEQLDVLCAAMQAWRGRGSGAELPLPPLEAIIAAFRRHNAGDLS